jgi:hypothetical protein
MITVPLILKLSYFGSAIKSKSLLLENIIGNILVERKILVFLQIGVMKTFKCNPSPRLARSKNIIFALHPKHGYYDNRAM